MLASVEVTHKLCAKTCDRLRVKMRFYKIPLTSFRCTLKISVGRVNWAVVCVSAKSYVSSCLLLSCKNVLLFVKCPFLRVQRPGLWKLGVCDFWSDICRPMEKRCPPFNVDNGSFNWWKRNRLFQGARMKLSVCTKTTLWLDGIGKVLRPLVRFSRTPPPL